MLRSNVRRGACSAVAAAGVIALGLGVAAPANATVDENGAVTIDVLSITDFHGAIAAAPNLAYQVQQWRDANPDTAFVSAGDSLGGSTFESLIQDDQPTIDVLNAIELDASALGNHEFDQGYTDLSERIRTAANWPYLGANVVGQDDFDPFVIETYGSGENTVDVAFVGSVTAETPNIVSGEGMESLTFEDPVETTNRYAAELSDGNPANGEADVVVALIHEGTSTVAPGLGEHVDVVFSGHSHQTSPTLDGTDSGLPAVTGAGAPIVQSASGGELLGHVQIVVAADGSIATPVVENIALETYPGTEAFVPEVASIVDAANAYAEEVGASPLGQVTGAINGGSNDGTDAGTSDPVNRGTESPLGNLLAQTAADAITAQGGDVDFGIINPGGIRADLDADDDGTVTYAEAATVLSFNNTLGTIELTGAQVTEMLEQQFFARGSRPALIMGLSSEISYLYDHTIAGDYDPTTGANARVTDVFIGGAPIDEAATYTVASNTFLLEGRDGFSVFAGLPVQEFGYVDSQALRDYLGDYLAPAAPLDPDYSQRSVGLSTATDLSEPFAPGETVSVDLASIAFTTDADAKPDVVEAIDWTSGTEGAVLATAEIDVTPTPGRNETGQATVAFTIPAGAADGEYDVRYRWTTGEGTAQVTQWVELNYFVAADAQPPVSPEPTNPTPTAPAPTDPPVDGGDDGDDQAGPGEGTLPETGAELSAPLAIVAMLVLLAGLGLVLRRRTV